MQHIRGVDWTQSRLATEGKTRGIAVMAVRTSHNSVTGSELRFEREHEQIEGGA